MATKLSKLWVGSGPEAASKRNGAPLGRRNLVRPWIQYHDIEATPQTHAMAREEKGASFSALRLGETEIDAAQARAEAMLSERGHECGRCDPRWHT